MSDNAGVRVLLLLVAALISLVVALVTGALARSGGANMSNAIQRAGVAFGGTATLIILAMNAVGLFPS
ncbi:hypothetical protein [Streptomyces antibioticus]|uniref:hypothetical protein n=1 Tax=Streptomyces antibioticus TaxID=1890 RepID=UPI003D76452A